MSEMSDRIVVSMRDVHVSRGDRWVLQRVDIDFSAHDLTAVVGANGSGKSTLLDVVAGLRAPSRGQVTHRARSRAGGRPDVAYVPQHTPESSTLPLTVKDVVSMGRWAERGPWRPLRRSDRELVARWIDRLDLGELAGRRLDTLSGGQRQRALVARALAQEASVLVLDEPTTGLDSDSRGRLREVLGQATREGAAVLVSTHDDQLVDGADRVVALGDGVAVHASPRTAVARR